MAIEIINADCRSWLRDTDRQWDTAFADPPDNIGLSYDGFTDRNISYYTWCGEIIDYLLDHVNYLWWSFNAKHTAAMGSVVRDTGCSIKPCVQTFTFGQHNTHDLGNNHRPLWRLSRSGGPLFPDAIRVESERQRMGDRRANPNGRVPGDVFDFPRVTGNSRQRRAWHPTQLAEGLVERCVKLTTPAGGSVLSPFGGTGTDGRVCEALGLDCTILEISEFYCHKMRDEHPGWSYSG